MNYQAVDIPADGSRWSSDDGMYKATVLGTVTDLQGEPTVVLQSTTGIVVRSLTYFHKRFTPVPRFEPGDIVRTSNASDSADWVILPSGRARRLSTLKSVPQEALTGDPTKIN